MKIMATLAGKLAQLARTVSANHDSSGRGNPCIALPLQRQAASILATGVAIILIFCLLLSNCLPSYVSANPAFTARTETYARGSSLTTPFSFTINKATGTVDGDIMFMFLAIYIATPPTVDSVPLGWTLVATNTVGNNRWYLYYKIASGEGTSYTWSLTASCRYYALNVAYSSGDFNVQSISDITAISNTLYSTAGTTVRAASMSVPAANSPLVYFGAVYSTAAKTFTKPSVPTSGWVEDADEGHTTPDLWLTSGSMIWSGSGATGNMDITCSDTITTDKHAFAVALKPASIISVSVSPGSYDFGTVVASATPYSTTTYFTLTNGSNVQTDQTISVTTSTWSGGVGWTHSDTCTPDTNTAGLKVNRGGTWGAGDIIVKYSSPNYIYENCPVSTGYSLGLKLWCPTSYTDGIQKQIIVRITAVAG